MTSKAARSFWMRYAELPAEVRDLADKNYRLWLANPQHPSLRFKVFKNRNWSVRVGAHFRAVGFFHDENTFVWTWIGTHEEYNKF